MGNQTGIISIDEDSGIFNPQDLFTDSLETEEDLNTFLETMPISNPLKNSTPKKLLFMDESIKETGLSRAIKSKSIGINLKGRLDSTGLSLSSSEEDDLRPDESYFDQKKNNNNIKNNIYSTTWSPSSNLESIKHSKSYSVDLNNEKYNQETTSGYASSFRKGMNYIGQVAKNLRGFYNDINSATLTGAIDVVVVEQEDGTYKCSPFHVRFGKLGVIRSKERVVDIEINGEPVEDLHMKLGEAGEAYFVQASDSEDECSSNESIPNFLKESKTIAELPIEKSIEYQSKKEELKPTASEPIPIKNPQNNEQAKSLDEKVQNFFSDGEITPEMTSPTVSRPSTPKSDTELEIKHKRNSISMENQWNWDWGQLPERQDSLSKKEIDETKKKLLEVKQNEQKLGEKYLDELDNEIADLYINQKSHSSSKLTIQTNPKIVRVEDDQESGKGFSAPQSPRDFLTILGDIQLSLCGFISTNLPSPVPRSPSDSQIYPSPSAESLLAVSPSNFKSKYLDIPNELSEQNQFEDLFQQSLITWEKFVEEMPTLIQNPNLVVKLNGRYMNWQSAAPVILAAVVYHKSLPSDQINTIMDTNMPKEKATQPNEKKSWANFFGLAKTKPTNLTPKLESVKSASLLTEAKDEPKEETTILTSELEAVKEKQIKRTTRLSSEQIKKLKLNPGINEIKYSVTTALQGTTRIYSYIFLWKYDDKIIVSDIDGTITRSDVWGQVLPLIGKDWTQSGVADLFTAIERNEYKFMYLSARAIGQSQITRNLLTNVNQNGFRLPYGPLLVTPTSLFTAFQKEVIERKPEEFKIQCLKDIQSLFPGTHNPLYAGYGNRTNDVKAYKTVGIDSSRIFTINPQGEVKHEVSRTFQSSYSKLCDFVDLIFTPYKKSKAMLRPEFDSYNYWRQTNVEDQWLLEMEQEVKKASVVGKSANAKETQGKKDAKKT